MLDELDQMIADDVIANEMPDLDLVDPVIAPVASDPISQPAAA